VFYRRGLLFAFNFHPTQSLTNVLVPVHQPGEYTVALSTDDEKYGGFGQIEHIVYPTKMFDGKHYVELYLPARTAVVLKERVILPEDVKPAKKTTRKPAAKKTETAKAAPAKKTAAKKTAASAEAAEKKPRTRRAKAAEKADEKTAE